MSPKIKLERLKKIFRSAPIHRGSKKETTAKKGPTDRLSEVEKYQRFSDYAALCRSELSEREEINIDPHVNLLNSNAKGLFAHRQDRILLQRQKIK